jgi:hypothetical protein
MRRISISAGLQARNEKVYLKHLCSDGFEMGLGLRGKYHPHAHRGFTDVAFAPGGLRISTPNGQLNGLIHIVPPGSWFGPIEFMSDFWFLKFFASERDICEVPDKLTDPTAVTGRTIMVAKGFDGEFGLFHPGRSERTIRLLCGNETLAVEGLQAGEPSLLITI